MPQLDLAHRAHGGAMRHIDADPVRDQNEISRGLPQNFSAWPPFLWSHVLFPGSVTAVGPFRWRSLLLLILLPGVLLYGCLSFHLFEPDEGRYAEIPREMLNRGDWIVPYLEGEPYLDKPPMLYWLVELSYRLFGVHDWSARLVPALAVHGCILLTYLFGRRILGERAAFWGGLLLSLAPGLSSIGRLLVMDGLLSFWTTLALFAGFESVRGDKLRWTWGLLAAVACGLGILTKGPVAILLLLPPLWIYRWLTGRSCQVGWRALLVFVLVTTGIAAPWYIAICVRLPAFAYHFLWQHNVVRFLAPFDHQRPIWFYAPILLLGLLPGTLAAFPFLRFLASSNEETRRRRCPALGFALLGGIWCIFFFSLSGCKLPTYILPAFPPLALALGYYLAQSHWERTAWPKIFGGTAFLILFVGHNVVLPWYAHYRAPMSRLAEIKDYCSDLQTALVCYPRNCDSMAFYLERDSLLNYRSKQTNDLVRFMQERPRTLLLLTHRHSLQSLRYALPPDLRVVEQKHFGLTPIACLPDGLAEKLTWLMGETSLGLCDFAVIEHCQPAPAALTKHEMQDEERTQTKLDAESSFLQLPPE